MFSRRFTPSILYPTSQEIKWFVVITNPLTDGFTIYSESFANTTDNGLRTTSNGQRTANNVHRLQRLFPPFCNWTAPTAVSMPRNWWFRRYASKPCAAWQRDGRSSARPEGNNKIQKPKKLAHKIWTHKIKNSKIFVLVLFWCPKSFSHWARI